ncbi:hypothetical protein HRG_012263 [Hirsutella rhossiliensis]
MSLNPSKNPFPNIGKWTPELLNQIEIVIDDVKETTSPFTRSKSPNNRYWKAFVHFKYATYESKIIKMSDCDIPHINAANYGSDFIIAKLQKCVGDKIAAEALKKDIIQAIQAPAIDTAIPQQKVSRSDIASQELIDEMDKLML